MTNTLQPISSIGSHRLAWGIATGLPLEHRYIDNLQGLIRLLLQNNGVIALTSSAARHQLGITRQMSRDFLSWAVTHSWITVLDDLKKAGKVYGLGSTWHQVDWPDVEQLAKDEHKRTQPKINRDLIRLAIAHREGKEPCPPGQTTGQNPAPQNQALGSPEPSKPHPLVPQNQALGSPEPSNRVKPAALQQLSGPNTPTDTSKSRYSKENSQAEVVPQASASDPALAFGSRQASGSGPAEIPEQPNSQEQPDQQQTDQLVVETAQTRWASEVLVKARERRKMKESQPVEQIASVEWWEQLSWPEQEHLQQVLTKALQGRWLEGDSGEQGVFDDGVIECDDGVMVSFVDLSSFRNWRVADEDGVMMSVLGDVAKHYHASSLVES